MQTHQKEKYGGAWPVLVTIGAPLASTRIASSGTTIRTAAFGAGFVAAGCDVEAIVLTGDLVRTSKIRNAARKRVARLAPVLVYEMALDMEHVAQRARDVLTSSAQAKHHPADESISGRDRK